MIQNERQYRITQTHLKKFRTALAELASQPSSLPPVLAKLEIDSLQGQMETLEAELKEYEALKAGVVAPTQSQPLSDLPKSLIRARIANRLTQEQLAKRLNLKPQQIQKYESTEYSGASLERVAIVADALGLRFGFEGVVPRQVRSSKKTGSQKRIAIDTSKEHALFLAKKKKRS